MNNIPVFGILLCSTYAASNTREPIERFFASMFGSYYELIGGQPSCATVNAIARGKQTVSNKILRYYWDVNHPRCPEKLMEDLTALAACCFVGATRRKALRYALDAFLNAIPPEDSADLREILCAEDLMQMWTCLIWYAICVR